MTATAEPFHRMTTTRFGSVWIASCTCGYMGLARESPAAAMEQGSEEHQAQLRRTDQ